MVEPQEKARVLSDQERQDEIKQARHDRRVRQLREGKGLNLFSIAVGIFRTIKFILIVAVVIAIFVIVGLVFFPDKLMNAWEIIKSFLGGK